MSNAWWILSVLLVSLMMECSKGNPRTKIISRTCRRSSTQNVTSFLHNVGRAMEEMETQMAVNGSGIGTAGDPPNRAYVMAQCKGDLSPTDCTICFSRSSGLLPLCFPFAGGRVYLNGCYLRAENYNFFNEIFSPEDSTECGLNENGGPNFNSVVRSLVEGLILRAPSEHGHAIGVENSRNSKAYVSVDCWRRLDFESCTLCLADAAAKVTSCLPANQGRALYAGCFIRYSNIDIFNDSSSATTLSPDMESHSHHPAYQSARSAYLLYIAILCIFSLMAIIIGLCAGKLIYIRFHCTKAEESNEMGVDLESSVMKRSLRFKYSTLEKATNFFSESNKLGEGGFGEVYKGSFADGREIAVKRLFLNSKSHGSQVYDEMNIISRLEHKNLVRLLGFSFTGMESFLIYEFVPNRSLDLMLLDPEMRKQLDWKKRLGIIMGMAEGLRYLHENSQARIVHRDIKASNILLDLRHRPKIADFGLARFFFDDGRHNNAAIAGTLGYMAPEYITRGQLTEKVDVYSYGVVLLEIISGVHNNRLHSVESTDTLVTYTWKLFQSNSISQVIDEDMVVDDIDEVCRAVQVGLLCTQESPYLRPSMGEIIEMLRKKDIPLPIPTKPPFLDESMELTLTSYTLLDPLQQTSFSIQGIKYEPR